MKKAAFTLYLEFDHDYTPEDINEVKDKLLHILKAETETGNIPVTMFSIRHNTTPITPSADHLKFPPNGTQFGILGQPPKKR